jgi:hypothetical protein
LERFSKQYGQRGPTSMDKEKRMNQKITSKHKFLKKMKLVNSQGSTQMRGCNVSG